MDAVPTFYLYGEPPRTVTDGFLHVERLDDRSRPSEWTIRPHAHADLVQLFLIEHGGGITRVEGQVVHFAAPALLVVPATVVHGFSWTEESAGSVLTVAARYLAELIGRDAGFAPLFDRARVLTLTKGAASDASAGMATLMRELGWSAPGHRAACESALLALLVGVLRLIGPGNGIEGPQPGRQAALVARYRARVDERFRLRESIRSHALALGIGESRLRDACARVAAMSPAAILDGRALLEARRALLYSNLSVAEVGYALGFMDPAYFTRFFTRHTGISPRGYRRRGGVINESPATGAGYERREDGGTGCAA